jgi:hypothetical protein
MAFAGKLREIDRCLQRLNLAEEQLPFPLRPLPVLRSLVHSVPRTSCSPPLFFFEGGIGTKYAEIRRASTVLSVIPAWSK